MKTQIIDVAPDVDSGLQIVRKNIEFINHQVLHQDINPAAGTAKLMAGQSAAMLIEDMRAFVQANEQLLIIGMAKALAMATTAGGAAEGKAALGVITTAMKSLTQYANDISSAAGSVFGFESLATPALFADVNATAEDASPDLSVDNSKNINESKNHLQPKRRFFNIFSKV